MGDFHEHVLFGLLLSAVTAYALEVNLGSTEAVTALMLVFVGSVLPDIDHKNAYVHRAVKSFASIATGLILFSLLPFSLSFRFAAGVSGLIGVYLLISQLKIQHRGVTHTISFCVILASAGVIAGVFLLGSVIPGIALGLGLLSHLLLDREFKL